MRSLVLRDQESLDEKLSPLKICISFWSRALGLSKMKELKQDIFGKGLFAARKGHLGLTKGHLDNPEGLMEVGSP